MLKHSYREIELRGRKGVKYRLAVDFEDAAAAPLARFLNAETPNFFREINGILEEVRGKAGKALNCEMPADDPEEAFFNAEETAEERAETAGNTGAAGNIGAAGADETSEPVMFTGDLCAAEIGPETVTVIAATGKEGAIERFSLSSEEFSALLNEWNERSAALKKREKEENSGS